MSYNTGDVVGVDRKLIGAINIKLLGERLRFYRIKRGWSPEELAVRTHCSSSYERKLEHGTVKSPSIEIIWSIAKALGIKATILLAPSEEEVIVSVSPDQTLQFIQSYIPVYGRVPLEKGQRPIDYMACTTGKPASQTELAYRIPSAIPAHHLREGDTVIIDTKKEAKPNSLVVIVSNDNPIIDRCENRPGESYFGVVIGIVHHLE